jgi:hypothetical protein
MNLDLLGFVAFTVVLVASVLGGHYIHTRHFKYATEGSSAMVLGTTLAGLVWLGYFMIYKRPLPQGTFSLPDTVFFNVSCEGVQMCRCQGREGSTAASNGMCTA